MARRSGARFVHGGRVSRPLSIGAMMRRWFFGSRQSGAWRGFSRRRRTAKRVGRR